ncbi:MAG: serine dehydratase [Marinilabiliales bacterium]|nr:MAG: serine dehydratase [Marinilabiliales bacterium]
MVNQFERVPVFQDVVDAKKRIEKWIHNTAVLSSESINSILGTEIFFKCENFQKVGAFKFRGASNTVLMLGKDKLRNGVATHSSGNHAAALALAASKLGVKAQIVMPENAPEIKKLAVKSYGAEIRYCEPTLLARETTLQEWIDETGAFFIHPYNCSPIIQGQGTAALELCNEIDNLTVVMAPVGGGGLLSGTAIACKGFRKSLRVFGAEPKMADDAYRSFKNGVFYSSENPKTIADGLLTSLGDLTFHIIMGNVDDIYTVSEDSIIQAMQMVWERMKIIIEPSSAVPLAVIMENPKVFKGQRVGIII